jgi:hypothetical protein
MGHEKRRVYQVSATLLHWFTYAYILKRGIYEYSYVTGCSDRDILRRASASEQGGGYS